MKDKELREIVYQLFYLLDENDMLYPKALKKLPPVGSDSLHALVSQLKKCDCKF